MAKVEETAVMEITDTTKRICELAAEEIAAVLSTRGAMAAYITDAGKTVIAAVIYKHIREQREI